MAFPLIIISSLVIALSEQSGDFDFSESRLWGPGLEPQKLVLPARYIFLELAKNYSALNGDVQVDFKVTGTTLDGQRTCRIWCNVLDRKDGSFILRYKMYEPCENMQIHVKYKGKDAGKSPYTIDGVVYSENCLCPKGNIDEWLKEVDCGETPDQIKRDLSMFKEINWNEIRNKVIKAYNKPESVSICHYVIKNNEIYRTCYGKYVGFKMFMDSALLSLVRKMRLPDVEFFANLGDWPLVKDESRLYPVLSWCGSDDSFDIIMPTYDITEATIENMGRVMLDMLSVQGNTLENWENRIPKVFWRGRDSNENRLKLIDTSRERPDLFNVSLTNFFFYRDQQEKYGPKSDHISFYRFFDYKYQVSIDGTVAAYRFPYLLAGGSLLFKQDSKYHEHFYKDLVEGEHYIPLKNDISDLLEKVDWAMENDERAKEIAANAQKFANENLLPKNIYCYHAHLFNEFSKLMSSCVEVLEGMEKVGQPKEVKDCGCGLSIGKDEL